MIYYKKKAQQDVGATAIEYGLIASLISVLAVGGMSAVGINLSNTYCTISKHLGGSGECSGSGSSGTGGNGSPAGSGNSTNGNEGNNSTIPTSVTNFTKEDMDNLKKSLLDNFYDDYVDSTLGGNNTLGGTDGFADNSIFNQSVFLSQMTSYNKKNPNDQITNVFGLYDAKTKQPITSWSKASLGLSENDGDNIYIGDKNQNNTSQFLEVTTQLGHVYTIDNLADTMTPNLVKGS
ncbi:Flp family type IVb pilin [Acetobacter lovaniensis]|uniref:Flp pilus assembly pilin Flp n=1 Tax=Acetobacter lovaniensis TaxID=104100 RepID=A0A841QJE6_9PROT|nr:Flp family type IVb pilin [Acetobacter lovaniensis]MBB6458344.1 Flp pilus assembly pilin Flp [Acetobacter lovaniensis]NHN82590.1 Flp family type IVb pilin [Acetobacter lovaniensis]GBQ70249.1 hypothetical protein AA0474_2142 [Acetobacter lovaniensis NRIC 0474]